MMNRTDVFNKVQEVFREVLEDEELIIKEDYNSEDIDDWDSLTHIILVVEIEKTFNMRFLSSEISNWKDIGAMITAIQILN
jgi:acyl carrier protein